MTRPEVRPWRAICLLGLTVLAVLTVLAATNQIGALDQAIRTAILRHDQGRSIALAHWVNHAGSWYFLAPAILALILFCQDARRHWWLWASVLPIAASAEGLLKEMVGRPRPESPAMGFPSGHVTAVAGFALMALYLLGGRRRPADWLLGIGAGALIGLVALARIVLRAHWPSDVVAGLALGASAGAAAAWWHAWWASGRPERASPSTDRVPPGRSLPVP